MGNKAKGDIVKTPGKDMHTERENSQTKSEATDLVIEPVLEQEAIARLRLFLLGGPRLPE